MNFRVAICDPTVSVEFSKKLDSLQITHSLFPVIGLIISERCAESTNLSVKFLLTLNHLNDILAFKLNSV